MILPRVRDSLISVQRVSRVSLHADHSAHPLLALEYEREALLEGKVREIGEVALLGERGGHPSKVERLQHRQRLFDQHAGSPKRVRAAGASSSVAQVLVVGRAAYHA